MDKIKFISDENVYKSTLYTITPHIIRLIFSSGKPTNDTLISGFQVYNPNGEIQGDFTDFTTIYRLYDSDDTVFELSNDGSVYEYEPTEVPDIDINMKPTLAQVKQSKINELSSICKRSIENGVDIEIDGTLEHFSYSIIDGDQGNIDDIAEAALTTGMGQSYHCDGGDCKIYTVEQIANLYMAQKTNKMHHTTYFNQLRQYVKSIVPEGENYTEEEIDQLILSVNNIFYGQALEGKYLDTYNLNMDNAKRVVEAKLKVFNL